MKTSSRIICKMFLISVFFLICTLSSAIASGDFSYFMKDTVNVHSWENLKELTKNYADDGIFEEGFSGLVERLFQSSYSELFKTKTYEDKKFIEFIERHIDRTWQKGNAEKLKARIERECPDSYKNVCDGFLLRLETVINGN